MSLLSSDKFTPKNQETYRINSFETYKKKWEKSISKPDIFWAEEARQHLSWSKNFGQVFLREESVFQWFLGGELNVSYNCLDRHLETKAQKRALVWEDEKGNARTYTYQELYKEVSRFASCLKSLGLKSRDCVTLYLSSSPELVISMLACARLGVIHNVVFAGFSPESLSSRIEASSSKLVITSDAFYRKGKLVKLKAIVDQALEKVSSTKKSLIFNRGLVDVSLKEGRDFFVHELLADMPDAKMEKPDNFPSEHPLFMIYTSGSTGAPKGLLHTSAGYLLGAAMTSYYLFNLEEKDLFWCTADIGWITGHTYLVYGPLALGATVFMYEGAPHTPDPGRLWSLIEKYKVTKFYTAPTAVRLCQQAGESWATRYDLSSLKLLGSVGEPINQKAWEWLFKVIGKERCPIVDTWWQSETGSTMLAPFPGLGPFKPGCASRPFFGVQPKVLDASGERLVNAKGSLVLEKHCPSMARTIYKNHERFEREYWPQGSSYYRTNDAALQDEDGEFWIHGRLDDVINVSGHRLSTMEIESFLCAHPKVAEASCVSAQDELTGESLCCFVVPQEKTCEKEAQGLKCELSGYIALSVGAFARPKQILLLPGLPKTRSGKVMRRTLRSLAEGKKPEGDLSTLEDPSIFSHII